METSEDLLIYKTFIFESENGMISQSLDIRMKQDIQHINIGDVINIFKQKNAIQHPLQFKIYDNTIQGFLSIDPSHHISKTYGYSPLIFLKYKYINQLQQNKNEDEFQSSKRQRNKERTIRQVLLCVKKWREMHTAKGRQKNKINLQDSAKVLGISKKSLDDYYCQLRLAQQYGFNFHNNIQQKVGVLRSYVKKCRSKGGIIKNNKLPRQLRIIQQLGNSLQLQLQKETDDLKRQQQQINQQNQNKILQFSSEQLSHNNMFSSTLQALDSREIVFDINDEPCQYQQF